jgi:hypothetical protein
MRTLRTCTILRPRPHGRRLTSVPRQQVRTLRSDMTRVTDRPTFTSPHTRGVSLLVVDAGDGQGVTFGLRYPLKLLDLNLPPPLRGSRGNAERLDRAKFFYGPWDWTRPNRPFPSFDRGLEHADGARALCFYDLPRSRALS